MSAVDRLLDSYLDLRWHFDPAAASAAGVTAADDKLGRFDAESMRQHLAAFHAVAAAVEDLEVEELEEEIDRTALLDDIRTVTARFEQERPQVHDPGFWLEHLTQAFSALVLRGATTAAMGGASSGPPGEVARAAAERMRAVPEFLESARGTLRRPPVILADRALGLLAPAGELLVHVTTLLGPEAPGGTEGLQQATGEALQALKRFGTALRDTIEPNAEPTAAALGEERFDRRIHHEHALREGATELWRAAERERAALEARLTSAAAAIAPGRPWREVVVQCYEERYTQAVAPLQEAIARMSERVAATGAIVPPAAPLEVIETHAVFASLLREPTYLPANAASGTARLIVGAGLALCEIPGLAAREAVPGRHLHATARAQAPTAVRRALAAPATVEGWSLYAEQLVDELELFETPEAQLVSLARRLEAVALLAVDVGLHARGLSPADAARLLTDWIPTGRDRAELVIRRAAAHPGRLLAAEAGRRELVRIRRMAEAGPERIAALRGFHEGVLAHGGLAPGLTAWGMGLA
ncbi:MAG TPA: DUF885 family protein [Gemmatimonadales bacterium]|nr:DUF885 family protein [Gemmatimonadales bacterium]